MCRRIIKVRILGIMRMMIRSKERRERRITRRRTRMGAM